MNPTPSPAAVYRISEKEPVFPCWLYGPGQFLPWCRYTEPAHDYGLKTHWSPDSPYAPQSAPDSTHHATPTPLSPAEGTPMEGVNTVGWPSSKMQDHVFDCHEEIRGLRDQLTAARHDLSMVRDGQENAIREAYKLLGIEDDGELRMKWVLLGISKFRRESEGLRAERERLDNLRVSAENYASDFRKERDQLKAELEKAKEERETDNKERNAHIASLQSALGKAEEELKRERAILDHHIAHMASCKVYMTRDQIAASLDSARSAQGTPGEGKGE